MTSSLPPHPSIENLRKQAKTLKKAWLEGDAGALARVRASHPQYADATADHLRNARPRLADCQLVVARESGFGSWPQLKVAVQTAGEELPDQFVSLACLCYDDPHYDYRSFHAQAHEMLRRNPWLAEANIWAAAATGNTAAVRALLDDDPALVNRAGPHGWAPLICACYARVQPVDPAHSTFEAAKLLLDRGADANAYTMKGNADERLDQAARRFTALTGLFGGGPTGMANEPPHPRWRDLAELLLERGADPADEEALRINQGRHGQTYAKLEILLRHGLTPAAVAKRADAGGLTLMGCALSLAVCAGDAESVKLLIAHGARTGETFRGKTPWQHATGRGHLEIARMLEAAGAPVAELDEVERFVSLCLAGDEREARAMLERAPGLLERSPKEMVLKAANGGRLEAVKLVLDLGFDPDWIDEVAALHHAAGSGQQEMARLLMQRGASLCSREPFYDGTPVGWAEFFDQRQMRDMLLDEGAICLFDALDFDRLDRVPDILARDPAARDRPFAECLSREPKAPDWQTPLARMVERGKLPAVRVLLERGAKITVQPDGRTLLQTARDKGFDEIAALLPERASLPVD
ncbi:MAG TPA: ankyrin repeat domain-containing protein [Bryobacteraceae bacterium]|nr:ankyrin repeat domain-containing protein [Bryobacteraceae bacterium]